MLLARAFDRARQHVIWLKAAAMPRNRAPSACMRVVKPAGRSIATSPSRSTSTVVAAARQALGQGRPTDGHQHPISSAENNWQLLVLLLLMLLVLLPLAACCPCTACCLRHVAFCLLYAACYRCLLHAASSLLLAACGPLLAARCCLLLPAATCCCLLLLPAAA